VSSFCSVGRPGTNVDGVSRRLADLRAPQLSSALTERSVIVLPLGAIEQHGPHLPFNTDWLIAERVAAAAVERVGDELDVWLLPSLAYTKSNEHAWSAGTIWLSHDTLMKVLDDIGRCVATTPARKLVFFNGHGGNSALVGVANREIRLAHGLQTFLTHPGVPPDQGGKSAPEEMGMGVHGGDHRALGLVTGHGVLRLGVLVSAWCGAAQRRGCRCGFVS
jgi:creatinine amidohydrolase